MKHSFTFFERYLPGVSHENLFLFTATFVAILLLIIGYRLYPRIKNAADNVIPKEGVSLQSIFEVLVEVLATFCDDVIGHGGRKYLPYLGTLFIFILISN
jgi:F0F1-type ATP synthase membrane subunit a